MSALSYMVPAEQGFPRWVDAEHTRINIFVLFPHLGDGVAHEYTATQCDPGWEHSEEIFDRAVSGEFGPIAPYVAPPEPVPFDVSRMQFGREMKNRGSFNQAEAIAFVSSTGIPPALQAAIDTLAAIEERDDAALMVLGASRFERNHPVMLKLAAGLGWNVATVDDFFRSAGKL